MYIRMNERYGGDVHETAIPEPFPGGLSMGCLGEAKPTTRTTCAGYSRGEVEKSLTNAGHLTPDVIEHARGLLVRDFIVDWRTPRPSVTNEPALRAWLKTLMQVVRANPTTRIRIVGFNDCVGQERNNMLLRSGRAVRVKQLLRQMLGSADWNVLEPRIAFAGAAPAKEYLTDNGTAEGRAGNRAVLIEHTRTVSFDPQLVQSSPPAQRVPCPPRTCKPVGRFLPSTHGFKFTNANGFDVKIPLPSPLPSIPASFGFCGGMSAAAVDYFRSCIPIPSTTTLPVSGDTLFKYLFDRQLESIGFPTFGIARKFLEWTNRPNTTSSLSAAAAKALGPTAARLGPILTGPLLPAVAGLVTVEGLQELTVPHLFET